MPHHRKTRAQSVPKGTAPLLFWPHTKKLRDRKMAETKPGKASAVRTVVRFHCSPCARQAVAPAAGGGGRLSAAGAQCTRGAGRRGRRCNTPADVTLTTALAQPASRPATHLEGLVQAGRGVAGKGAQEAEQEQHRGHEAAAVGGAQEAQRGKHLRVGAGGRRWW